MHHGVVVKDLAPLPAQRQAGQTKERTDVRVRGLHARDYVSAPRRLPGVKGHNAAVAVFFFFLLLSIFPHREYLPRWCFIQLK